MSSHSGNVYDSILARLQVKDLRIFFFVFFTIYFIYPVPSPPVFLLIPHFSQKMVFVCLAFVFRRGLLEALIWFRWMAELSISYVDFSIIYIYIFVTQGTSETFLRHSCKLNRTVILWAPWMKHKCSALFLILQGNRGDCYVILKSCVSQDFH